MGGVVGKLLGVSSSKSSTAAAATQVSPVAVGATDTSMLGTDGSTAEAAKKARKRRGFASTLVADRTSDTKETLG